MTPNHIEFTDNRGDMIHLMRGDTALKTNSSQLALSPYQSGYEHGVNDAKGNGNGNMYITSQGKGFAFHTPEFNKGYVAGDCSLPENHGKYVGLDADEATFNCVEG